MINPSMLFYKLIQDLQPYLSEDLYYNLSTTYRNKKYRPEVGFIPPKIKIPEKCGSMEYKAVALLNSIFKKLEPEGKITSADSAAFDLFRETNRKVGEWDISLLGKWSDSVQSNVVHMIIGSMKNDFYNMLYTDDLGLHVNQLGAHLDTGPGKQNGCSSFDFFQKLFGPELTTSSLGLHKLYCGLIEGSSWFVGEIRRMFQFGEPLVVKFSKQFFAPKNCEVSRGAATEPTENMTGQLSAGQILVGVLCRYFGIVISFQQLVNIKLAKLGSLTGEYVTLDLKSASDCISVKLIQELFPREAFLLLMLLRSDKIMLDPRFLSKQEKKGNGSEFFSMDYIIEFFLATGENLEESYFEELNMIGTMGNGFTFPLQTLLFAVLLKNVYDSLNIPLVRSTFKRNLKTGTMEVDKLGNFSIFGDDIIVVKEASELMVYMLDKLGLVVNLDKSCTTGYFRESCGGDYLMGIDVRPLYIKRLGTLQERFVALNNCIEWSAAKNMPLPRFTNAIFDLIPADKRNFVPRTCAADAGIRVPEPYLPIRFLRYFQLHGYYNYEAYVADTMNVNTEVVLKRSKIVNPGFSFPVHYTIKEHYVDDRYWSELCGGNPLGYLVTALRGNITDGKYSTRYPAGCEKNYSLKSFSSHNWIGTTSYFDEQRRILVFLSPAESMILLGLCEMSTWKRVFETYELIR